MTTPLIASLHTRASSAAHAADPTPPDRVVWVLHMPFVDRRTQKPIPLSDVQKLGTEVRTLFATHTTTVDAYTLAARALYDAWDEFEDGDVVVSMGGDLHTVSMVDDILRQRGVRTYVWARHVGHGAYVEFVKRLDETDFVGILTGRPVSSDAG
jgi:hypothetical protein